MWLNLDDKEWQLVKDALACPKGDRPATEEELAVRGKIEQFEGYQQPTDHIYISQARESYCDDELEIDDDPAVSHADDGAWVAAWVWVAESDVEAEIDDVTCRTCGAVEGTDEYGTVGDGFDGECGDCADKREEGRIERAAKKLYTAMTDNDPTVHSNRFPSWDELAEEKRQEWRDKVDN